MLYHLIHMLVVNSDLGEDVDELVALSKAKPGTFNYVTPGPPLVLYMETLRKQRGADWVRVPFRGGGETVNAILERHHPDRLFGEGNVIGHIRAGAMTPLAMMNNVRSPNFPNVPLLAETGYAGLRRAVGMACLRRPARRGRSSTASTRRSGRSSASPTSPPSTYRAQPGAGAQLAGGVRRRDRARPRAGQAGGLRRRDDAAVAATGFAHADISGRGAGVLPGYWPRRAR